MNYLLDMIQRKANYFSFSLLSLVTFKALGYNVEPRDPVEMSNHESLFF